MTVIHITNWVRTSVQRLDFWQDSIYKAG